MIEIDDFKIKQYRYGYELHEPYDGFVKSGDLRVEATQHRITYWPNLKSVCIALLDRRVGKEDGVPMIVTKLEECTQRIMAAVNKS